MNLIVVKSNELLNHSFDLDIVTKKSKDGKLKLFLGIDKVKKHDEGDEIASDTVNQRSPERIAAASVQSGHSKLSMREKIDKIHNDIERYVDESERIIDVGSSSNSSYEQG